MCARAALVHTVLYIELCCQDFLDLHQLWLLYMSFNHSSDVFFIVMRQFFNPLAGLVEG